MGIRHREDTQKSRAKNIKEKNISSRRRNVSSLCDDEETKKNFIIKENHQLFYSARGCKFKTFRNSVISSGITTLFLPSFEHKQKECLKFPFGRGPPL